MNEWKALYNIVDCSTKHALHWAPIEREGVEFVFGGSWGRGGARHVFFIYVDCLNVSQGRDGGWSYGSGSSR